MNNEEGKLIEIPVADLENFIQFVYKYSGMDFSGYTKASFKRRLRRLMSSNDCKSLFDLKHKLINNKNFLIEAINYITVNVTEMYRDPTFYKAIIDEVVPVLRTYPRLRVWHAGCATGEEVYSLAILFKEAGLDKQTKVYATDLNHDALDIAQEGIYQAKLFKQYSINYQNAGGKNSLPDYFTIKYDLAKVAESLKKNIVFSMHNLVSDSSFNEFNIIICRNVLIYFDTELQNKCFDLFYESLPLLGFLMLGNKESLISYDKKDRFEVINKNEKIYRKIK